MRERGLRAIDARSARFPTVGLPTTGSKGWLEALSAQCSPSGVCNCNYTITAGKRFVNYVSYKEAEVVYISSFFAYLSRLRFIQRWSLMRNTRTENVQEHSLQVAHIAHALAVLHNARYGGGADPARAAELAIYHEAGEVMTGDLATPIKYFSSDLTSAYKRVERIASGKMLAMLPPDMREIYASLLLCPEKDPEWPRVKAADRICAYLKCVEEERMGNLEFTYAKESILQDIQHSELGEVGDFMREFAPAFEMTLDELNR